MDESGNSPAEVFSIRVTSAFENDDEALETLVQLKELDFDEVFTSRQTQLDAEGGEGISITFHHDEKENLLRFYTDSESNIKSDLALFGDDISAAESVLERLLDGLGQTEIDEVAFYKVYEIPYEALQLPIEEETEYQVTGVKISHEGRDYIIQKDGDETSVNMEWKVTDEDTESVISSIGEQTIEVTREFVESLT